MFDFSKTESATESSYLKPGVYNVKITKGEFGKSKEKETPFVAFTFSTEEGPSVVEKFMITEKAISRLQYLHEAWVGKKLEKNFKSEKEVADYFIKIFTSPKAGSRKIVVGGETTGKNVYASIPYANFIVGDDSDLELGPFEEDSEEWKKYVKKSTRTNESTGKRNGILNDTEESKSSSKKSGKSNDEEEGDDGEDMPW